MSIKGHLLPETPAPGDTRYKGYERPATRPEARLGEVELRRVAAHVVAQTQVEGARDAALSEGFSVLARYIYGGNPEGRRLAMTVPVAQAPRRPVAQEKGEGGWRVTFVMPSDTALADLPDPGTDRIAFHHRPEAREAVIAFTGRATEARLTQAEARLRATLAAEGLTPTGPVAHYHYDDPYTAPWARRTEVALPLP